MEMESVTHSSWCEGRALSNIYVFIKEMGDAADILGVKSTQSNVVNGLNDVGRLVGQAPKAMMREKVSKPKGMSRELFALMGKDGIVPAVQPAKNIGAAFKSKWTSSLKGKWVFGEYANSARQDGVKFKHWMKADVDYQDYTYAKFNVRIEPFVYTDDEYDELLNSSTWTRSETDHLMFLCHKYNLRWPVIADRYAPNPPRTCQDLQQRYYTVITKVKAHRANAGVGNMRNEAHTDFDIEADRVRRLQLEAFMRKALSSHDREEKELREELRDLDAQIKKLKKSASSQAKGKAETVAAAAALASTSASLATGAVDMTGAAASAGARAPVQMLGMTVGSLSTSDDAGTDDMPEPASGKPALQSSRLMVVESAPGVGATLSRKANWMLRELQVPDYPIATRAVCDMLDNVRKNVFALLSVESALQKKERELQMLYATTAQIQREEAAGDGKRGSSLTGSSAESSSSTIPALPNPIVIPHSMIAGKIDYRPAPMSQTLSLSNSQGIPPTGPGLRKVASANQKRKLDEHGHAATVAGAAAVPQQYLVQGSAGMMADPSMMQKGTKRRK